MTEDAEKLLSQLAHGDRSEESVCVCGGESRMRRGALLCSSASPTLSLSVFSTYVRLLHERCHQTPETLQDSVRQTSAADDEQIWSLLDFNSQSVVIIFFRSPVLVSPPRGSCEDPGGAERTAPSPRVRGRLLQSHRKVKEVPRLPGKHLPLPLKM